MHKVRERFGFGPFGYSTGTIQIGLLLYQAIRVKSKRNSYQVLFFSFQEYAHYIIYLEKK
jgi:hypothetical protein